jgi:hypothetical protein
MADWCVVVLRYTVRVNMADIVGIRACLEATMDNMSGVVCVHLVILLVGARMSSL